MRGKSSHEASGIDLGSGVHPSAAVGSAARLSLFNFDMSPRSGSTSSPVSPLRPSGPGRLCQNLSVFHSGDSRFRAWLGAFARAEPRSPRKLTDEVRRLTGALAGREADAAALERRLARTEARVAELERDRERTLAYVAELETDRSRLLESQAALEADRARALERVSSLEAALEERRAESERWLRILPFLRVRPPGGAKTANRLRALRRRPRR
jgi:hypothetical protein